MCDTSGPQRELHSCGGVSSRQLSTVTAAAVTSRKAQSVLRSRMFSLTVFSVAFKDRAFVCTQSTPQCSVPSDAGGRRLEKFVKLHEGFRDGGGASAKHLYCSGVFRAYFPLLGKGHHRLLQRRLHRRQGKEAGMSVALPGYRACVFQFCRVARVARCSAGPTQSTEVAGNTPEDSGVWYARFSFAA